VRFSLILFPLIVLPCWSQTAQTGKAETSGFCSPAVSGSNNQFTITCQNIPDKLRVQLVDLLNRVTKNQNDAEAMMAKLDGCLAGVQDVKEKLGGWKLDNEAQVRLREKLKPYAGTHFVLAVNPDESKFMDTLDGILRGAGWAWQQPKPDNPLFTMTLGGKASINYSSGITIQVSKERWKDLGPAAESLVKGLIAEGIPAKGNIFEEGEDFTAIQVVIGKRE
jgi:hypothetical protein